MVFHQFQQEMELVEHSQLPLTLSKHFLLSVTLGKTPLEHFVWVWYLANPFTLLCCPLLAAA